MLQYCSEPYGNTDDIITDHMTLILYVRKLSDDAQRHPRATMSWRHSSQLLYREDSVVKTTVAKPRRSAFRAPFCSTDALLTTLFGGFRILDDRAATLQKEDVILRRYENHLGGAPWIETLSPIPGRWKNNFLIWSVDCSQQSTVSSSHTSIFMHMHGSRLSHNS